MGRVGFMSSRSLNCMPGDMEIVETRSHPVFIDKTVSLL
ncbi:hypothetical protein BMS3Bbin04_01053 [bacterium BMS3Bbin04]|nr:hypothetical protein BMS3Bbin04_01053 [bacterium BMS3Bbin04]